jgi:hypothetical protein
MSNPIGIHKLITSIPEDCIQVQNVAHNATNFNNGKKQATITFATNPVFVQDLMNASVGGTAKNVALVLWFPADKMAAALAGHGEAGV